MSAIASPPLIPFLKQKFPGEVLLHIRKDPLGVLKAMTDLGDCSRLKLGPINLYMINHPDLIRDVLVTKNSAFRKGRAVQLMHILLGKGLLTSEGGFHRRQRKLVLPAFHHSRLTYYADIMAAYAARRHKRWQDGSVLQIEHEMMNLTLEIVAKTLFNANVDDETDEITEALTEGQEVFGKIANPFSEIILRLPLPATRKIKRVRKRLDTTIYRFIEEHRQNPADQQDLLSMLLDAQDEETGTGMSDEQVRDEAMTLFAAGHETTAVALTWTWVLLSQHPEVEAQLHEEVDRVLEGRLPTFSDLAQLSQTRRVLSEALRLYPPAYALTREATEDVQIGEYSIPKGATVDMSPYLIHRDARFWPDPERFNPDRFAPENKSQITKFSYIPFSFGIRGCIGEQFAWTEAILLLATLAQRWKLRLVDQKIPEVRPVITLRPEGSVGMRVEARN